MNSLFSSGLSGLFSAQSALATTSHNISNVNTPGFSRQQVLLATRPAQSFGGIYIGNGVDVQSVRRIYDNFVTGQMHSNTAAYHRLEAFSSLASQIDSVIADPNAGIGTSLQGFFDSLQALADDPASLPAREVVLGEAQLLADRFAGLDARLYDLDQDVNFRMGAAVGEINTLATALASLNDHIVDATASGSTPNDLLDQRDELLRQLNEKVAVTTFVQDDGAMNVFIGNGLALVHGKETESLSLVAGNHEPGRLEVAYSGDAGSAIITKNLSGGELGGALDFRRDMLDPTRNALGRIAAGLAETLNQQHSAGTNLLGELGGDFFSVPQPQALPATTNGGSAALTVGIADIGALDADDYLLTYDGGTWQAFSAQTGQPAAMSGAGTTADPFLVGGVSISVSAGAAAGDNFLVRPTARAAGGLELLIDDAREIAAAVPVLSEASLDNTGTASISPGSVVDVNHPNLLFPVTIEFVSGTTYTIDGTGPFAYTSGDPIVYNGWQVEVSGDPATGDVFTVGPNTGADGDNRNAAAMAGLSNLRLLDGGQSSFDDSNATIVASVGNVTRQTAIGRDAQKSLLDQSELARLAVSGVNLDEEAANLVRFEQAYQASAQILQVAENLFETVLGVIGR